MFFPPFYPHHVLLVAIVHDLSQIKHAWFMCTFIIQFSYMDVVHMNSHFLISPNLLFYLDKIKSLVYKQTQSNVRN